MLAEIINSNRLPVSFSCEPQICYFIKKVEQNGIEKENNFLVHNYSIMKKLLAAKEFQWTQVCWLIAHICGQLGGESLFKCLKFLHTLTQFFL